MVCYAAWRVDSGRELAGMSSVLSHDDGVESLLADLRRLDIKVYLDGDALRIRGAKTNLTPALTQRIQRYKSELIIFLHAMENTGKASKRIPQRAANTPVPLSFLQQNLWLIDQLEGSVHYNMAAALNVEGELDAQALERALRSIVERHESLRTVFRVGEHGRPQQIIREGVRFELGQVDLTALAGRGQADEVRRLCSLEARRPFDLANDLMMRSSLLHLTKRSFVLLITMHHIASDGWSMDVLMDDMCQLYEAYRRGEGNPLPPLPIQYADYSVWLQGWLQGALLREKLDYWVGKLNGLAPLHAVPLDRSRPLHRTINGERHARAYPRRQYQALLAMCHEQDVTLFTLLEAAFAVFLSRWSGERDIAIGTPISARSRPELARMIGYFTNTLVLRSDCADRLSFLEFLQASKRTMLEAHEHHHIPFEMLVDELQPERSLAHNALVQITFTLQNNKAATVGTIELPGLRIASFTDNERIAAKFDLELTVKEHKDGLLAKWSFNTDIFERATIERMDRHFEQLLESILADPSRALARLPLLPKSEVERVAGWNATAVDFPKEDTLVSLFERQARAAPGQIALVLEDQTLSCGELNARANSLARRLVTVYGVGPGVRVGHCLERSPELVVALLAIMKAGGAYVALDPGLPPERLAYMLADSDARVVLTQPHLASRLGTAQQVEILAPDRDQFEQDEQDLPLRAGPDDLAYVIYTSGSTGRPKGTLNLQRGVCNRIHAMQRQFGLTSQDRVLQKTPLSFDVSVWELFWPLSAGAVLVLAAPQEHKDPHSLARTLLRQGVTVVHFVPSMLQAFLRSADRFDFPALRYLMTSGEALSYELQSQCIAAFPHVRKVNHYGPTETAIEVTGWPFDAPRSDRIVPIGRPIANVRIHILDAHALPVPVGVAGELYIGGVQVGEGYLNNPALTAERFVTLEVGGGSERVYRTGDRARWLEDGEIEYLGRLDHQIKLRGQRIELGEIEACLVELDPVGQAAVVLTMEEQEERRRLVAYIVPSDAGAPAPDTAALKSALRTRLPDYMVPAQFVYLTALPLTASGKLDRRALPSPVAPEDLRDSGPATPFEELLIGLWGQVLGRAPDGVGANFFELGGHSLLATQLVSLIRRQLSIEMPLKVVFEHPVLRTQALWLAQQRGGGMLPAIEVRAPEDYVLSLAQQGLWWLVQLEGAGSAFNIPRVLLLSGALDVGALERSFTQVVRRHSNLRLCFPIRNGVPVVRMLDPYEPLVRTDLRHMGQDEQTVEVERLADEHARYSYDLTSEPLFKVRLLLLGNDRHLLLVNMHHIISDGWSIGILLREVGACYAAYCLGREPDLTPLPVQYPDYALWQRAGLTGALLEQQRAYWRAKLQGAPALLPVPTDHPRPARFSYRGTHFRADLDASLRDGLTRLSRKHGCTVFMTVLAAFNVLLARLTGQEDISVGTPIANRTHHQTESLIGLFANILVMRAQVDPEQSFAQFLVVVRQMALEAYQHQDLPFDQLVEELKPVRSLSHGPLFQVVFRYETSAPTREVLPGVTLTQVARKGSGAQFDLVLVVIETAAGLECEWGYATDLFEEATVARLHQHLNTLLRSILADDVAAEPVQLRQLALFTPQEWRQLAQIDTPLYVGPQGRLIHELFEEWALRSPQQIAVTWGEEQLRYGELNGRANHLAHNLLRQGVKPDDRVALCVERGPLQLVGILGILKAGGAYVPLDPGYPVERLLWMLSDSAPMAIVTESALVAPLSSSGIPITTLDSDWSVMGAPDAVNPESTALGLRPHHLAYVIYTSGSTGQPKGVMVEHRQVVRLMAATRDWFGFDERDVSTLFHSYAFDFSVWEIWGALAYGGRLVIVPASCARSPEVLYELLCRENVTVLNQTPSAFRGLIAAQAATQRQHALRYVILGGEALEFHTLIPWIRRNDLDRTQLINMYGITETTVHVTYRRLGREDIGTGKASLIGRPIPDMRLYVLDAYLQPVPEGVVGELYVGGAGLARGYLNREELTRQRFIANPFLPGERLYKSGDLGRRIGASEVEYRGRNDFQIKIRGFRIELGEIEAKLAACQGVRAAAVIACDGNNSGDKRLVAYVVPYENTELSAAELRVRLSRELAEYMIPSAFVTLKALPLTANGKLDRAALPTPDSSAVASRDFEPPVGELEQALAIVWQELLGVERVGRHDNFFELGGHSLLILGLLERLRSRGLATDVQAVFAAPLLSELAQRVRADTTGSATAISSTAALTTGTAYDLLPLTGLAPPQLDALFGEVPGGVANVQDVYPLAPLQEGFLFHHLLEKDSGGDTYLLRLVVVFDSRARLEEFVGALQAVVDRHDILRTAVHWQGLPKPVQIVQRRAPVPVFELELRQEEPALQQLLTRTDPSRLRLDLRTAPLLATYIARDPATGEWLLALLNHHMIEDAYSRQLMFKEIRSLLRGDGLPAPAAELSAFRNFIAAVSSAQEADHEAYFREQFGDVTEPTAPFGLLDVCGGGWRVREARVSLAADLAARVREAARRHGVTAAVLFHVAFARVLAQFSGRDDVVFGTVLSGRLQGSESLGRAVGILINTLPVRIPLAARSVAEVVRDTRERLSELLRHEHAALALALRCSAVAPPLPLFTALLNYRHSQVVGAPREGEERRGEWAGLRFIRADERTHYPLTLMVNDDEQDFRLLVQCAVEIGPARVARSLEKALGALVGALMEEPAKLARDMECGLMSAATLNVLAGIWRTLLEVEQVGPDDDFFAIGGHSLLALRLVERIRAEFGVDVPLVQVFRGATLSALGDVIDSARAGLAT
jgi:amino acid adenylation domain-containing protein